jgi:pimeloyl-ACP methyl ester carboxylesterase
MRVSRVIEGAGHWVQQEAPEEVNIVLLEFLNSLN